MPRGPYLLVVAVAFAAGVAMGALVGGPRGDAARAPAREEPRPRSQPNAETALAVPLAKALEPTFIELRRAIAALTEGLERRAVLPRSPAELPTLTRVPADENLGNAALAAAIARLAEAVQVLERSPGGGMNPAHRLVAPTWVDREAAFAGSGMREAARVDDDGTAYQTAEAAFQQRHILWSTQDLLSSYGKPDTIEVNGDQAQWSYEILFRGGEEYYHFYVHGETVVQTDYDWDFLD